MAAKRSPAQQNLAAQVAILSELVSEQVEGGLRKQGHSLSTFQLLSAIKASETNITQAELAQRMGITAASLCEALKTASNKGLVEQKPSDTDRRAKRVSLTKQGNRLISETLVHLDNVNLKMLHGIGSSDLKQTERILSKCIGNLAGEDHG
ncbi:MAG: winged helix-turn-helix transcriptional regulator [Fimbriimonadaceae bacterium]|nr:winged helix-turn-helix transcriptional regulator [Fimbriimonadaceae bacterium]